MVVEEVELHAKSQSSKPKKANMSLSNQTVESGITGWWVPTKMQLLQAKKDIEDSCEGTGLNRVAGSLTGGLPFA